MIPAALAGLGVLILSGCFNVLDPSREQGEDAGSAGGSVTIRVSGSPEAARTLYPRAEFSKIVLSFTPKGGQTAYGPETLPTGESSVVLTGLENGNWEVSAKGYVQIDANGDGTIGGGEEFEAASSSPVSFTIISGSAQVNIPLSAEPMASGGTGYFSYSVSFPPGKVDTASLRFTTPNGGVVYDSSTSAYIGEKDLKANPSGTISLAPGYYLVRIELQNIYQRAGRTEIVHIYPNMETRADYTFTPADFTDFIVLSGTVDIKIDGIRPDYAYVSAYKSESYGSWGDQLGYGDVQWDGGTGVSTGTWKVGILPSSPARNVILEVSTQSGGFSKWWETGVTVTVSNTDYPNIPITINKQTLTLSGTAAVTVNGSSFGAGPDEYIQVSLYDKDGSEGNYGNQIGYGSVNTGDGTWSMVIEKPASPVTYYIELIAWINNSNVSYSKRNVKSVFVSGADVSGITVTHDFTVLSGTAVITANGYSLPAGTSVSIYLSPNPNGYGQIGYANVGADGTWSMSLDVTPASGTYYFGVDIWTSSYYNPNVRTITFPTGSYSGIAITHNFSQ
jgi:hypothetical protein